MRLTVAPSASKTSAAPVADALARRRAAAAVRSPADELSSVVRDSSRVTDVAEQAVQFFGALAKGQELDPKSLEVEMRAVLDLLDDLDRGVGSTMRFGLRRRPRRSLPSRSGGWTLCTRSTMRCTRRNKVATPAARRGCFTNWAALRSLPTRCTLRWICSSRLGIHESVSLTRRRFASPSITWFSRSSAYGWSSATAFSGGAPSCSGGQHFSWVAGSGSPLR